MGGQGVFFGISFFHVFVIVSGMANEFFSYSRRVNFAETDAAGIAHFSNFPRWVEEAELAFWRERGFVLPKLAEGCLEGFPKVSFSIRHRSPVRFGDLLEVALTPACPSASAIEWAFRIRREGALCASGTMVVVFASGNPLLGELRSRTLPVEMEKLLRIPSGE